MTSKDMILADAIQTAIELEQEKEMTRRCGLIAVLVGIVGVLILARKNE